MRVIDTLYPHVIWCFCVKDRSDDSFLFSTGKALMQEPNASSSKVIVAERDTSERAKASAKVTLDELFVEEYGPHLKQLVEYVRVEVQLKWPGITIKLHGYLTPKTLLILAIMLVMAVWPVYLLVSSYGLWPSSK